MAQHTGNGPTTQTLLVLHHEHLDDLRRSGLSDATIQGAGIYTVPPAEINQRVGFNAPDVLSAYAIPYPDATGKVLLTRYKPFPPHVGVDGKTAKYLHPIGQAPIPYILPHVAALKDDVQRALWVTEGEKKALKLMQHGEPAIALSGVWNFKPGAGAEGSGDLWPSLQAISWVERLTYLALDADLWFNPNVRAALWELGLRLTSKGALVRIVQWPASEGKGIDDYLVHHEAAGKPAENLLSGLKEGAKTLLAFIHPDHERAILRAFSVLDDLPPLVTYSALIDRAAKTFGVKSAALAKMIASSRAGRRREEIPEADKEKARQLLRDPQLITHYLAVCHTEYLGRENELLLTKLCAVSRKFARGVSMVVTGPSSVGKSLMVEVALKTVWHEDAENFSRVTSKYLYYRQAPLDHRVLAFYELDGVEEAAYVMRTMLTEGRLRTGTVVEEGGQYVSREIDKSADGAVIISTTTSSALDHELETRVLHIDMEHDPELARKVYEHKIRQLNRSIGHDGSPAPDRDKSSASRDKHDDGSPGHRDDPDDPYYIWRVADHLLAPLEVVIPYGQKIAEVFPTGEERYHRDFDRVLGLIQSSALLHQYQRPRDDRDRVIAARADYEIAYRLRDLISQSVSPAPDHLITFLSAVKQLTRADRGAMTYPRRDEVMKNLGVSDESMKRYVRACCQKDWLEVTGKGGKQVLKVLDVPRPVSPIPHPDEIFGSSRGDPMTECRKTATEQALTRVTPGVTGADRNGPADPAVGDTLEAYVEEARRLFGLPAPVRDGTE